MTHKRAKGFTLVELLVVIAIIATLATMAMPAILGALLKAKITTAKNICVSVESAVDRFENDYSYLPFDGTGDAGNSPTTDEEVRSDSGLMAVLAGVEDDINYKKSPFFSLPEPKGSSESSYKDGMHIDKEAKTAMLYDAWGEPYYLVLDYDLDGAIDHPFKSDEKVNGKKVLVFSTGPEGPEVGKPTGTVTNKVLRKIPSNFN